MVEITNRTNETTTKLIQFCNRPCPCKNFNKAECKECENVSISKLSSHDDLHRKPGNCIDWGNLFFSNGNQSPCAYSNLVNGLFGVGQLKKLYSSDESYRNFYSDIGLYLWMTQVVKNLSYVVASGPGICYNGREMENGMGVSLYGNGGVPSLSLIWGKVPRPHYASLYLGTELNSFRFITCHYKGHTGHVFTEFVSVYDKLVWSILAFSVVLVATSLKFVSGNNKSVAFANLIMSLLEVLLEQGDPFPNRVASSTRFRTRILLISFMLVGILLSNGYKNDNVYNMILPREELHYKNFEELTILNFSVYTDSRSGPMTKITEADSKNLKFQGHYDKQDLLVQDVARGKLIMWGSCRLLFSKGDPMPFVSRKEQMLRETVYNWTSLLPPSAIVRVLVKASNISSEKESDLWNSFRENEATELYRQLTGDTGDQENDGESVCLRKGNCACFATNEM